MSETRSTLTLISFSLLLFSCTSDRSFDSEKWNSKGLDWWMTDIRERMVNDIIQSDTLIGLQKNEVVDLLGQPDKIDSNKLFIFVREKYTSDIDPDYIKYLVVELDKMDKVHKVSVLETK